MRDRHLSFGLCCLFLVPVAGAVHSAQAEPAWKNERRVKLVPDGKELATPIISVSISDLGSYSERLRYSILIRRSREVVRTETGSNRKPAAATTTKGSVSIPDAVMLFTWIEDNLAELEKISANDGECDGGCHRLVVVRDNGATLSWTASDFDVPLLLWTGVQVVDAVAGRTALSACGEERAPKWRGVEKWSRSASAEVAVRFRLRANGVAGAAEAAGTLTEGP